MIGNGGRLIGYGASRASLRVPHTDSRGPAAFLSDMSEPLRYFSRTKSRNALAKAIGCKTETIESVLAYNNLSHVENALGASGEPAPYRLLRIPKKNKRRTGEYRTVVEVLDLHLSMALKSLSRRLDVYLRKTVPQFPTAASYGFISGSSTFHNATQHLGHRMLLTADIKEFFNSITKSDVERALIGANILPEAADLIASFTTINGRLPLGFSTSPLLSNLVCISLDIRLSELAIECGAVYTRYADDLAFSSDARLPNIKDLRSALSKEGFSLAEDKVRISRRGQRQVVTGLTIADKTGPRVPREFKRRLRKEIYYCDKYGIKEHADGAGNSIRRVAASIDGRIGYVQGIEPVLGEKLREKWREILKRESLNIKYSGRNFDRPTGDKILLFDESHWKDPSSDRHVIAVACVDIGDHDGVGNSLKSLAISRYENPFYGGTLPKYPNVFHYSDDYDRAKDEVCDELSNWPLHVSVAFRTYRSEDEFHENFTPLFGWLLTRRMGASDGKLIRVICDRHDGVGVKRLSSVIAHHYSRLIQTDARRPFGLPSVSCPSKSEEPLLALPDYFLGILGAYIRARSSDMGKKEVRRFENLRDKYRLIRNFDEHTSFNRQRKFDHRDYYSE